MTRSPRTTDPDAQTAARSAELEQLARESIQNAEHLTERKNYSGAIKEYQRAAELRKQTAAWGQR